MITLGGFTFALSTIIVTIMILKINIYADKCGKYNKSWDFVEWFFAVIFGWVSVVYILVTYASELFTFSCPKKSKKKKKENTDNDFFADLEKKKEEKSKKVYI